jgi:GAF domain-containing protein
MYLCVNFYFQPLMNREKKYDECAVELGALLEEGAGLVSNFANAAALIHHKFGFFWTGFYMVEGDKLTLGPFQGPVACTFIEKGKGVCGASWARAEGIVVPDVHKFPGHIACNPESRSEIVLPVYAKKGKIIAILDIDSKVIDDFTESDMIGLEKLTSIITQKLDS